jgi:hypothetical protein
VDLQYFDIEEDKQAEKLTAKFCQDPEHTQINQNQSALNLTISSARIPQAPAS